MSNVFSEHFGRTNENNFRSPNRNINTNQNRNQGRNSQSQHRLEIRNQAIKEVIAKINEKPLSQCLTLDDIHLPDGLAYQIASSKELMNTNQLRKFFDMIKQVESHTNDINKCQEELIKILPQIAYSVGRKNCSQDFFFLMKSCISRKTITSEKDVHVLIDFITSIVAYNKFLNNK